jgi:hypothetical protein
MTNIYTTPNKLPTRDRLLQIGYEAMEKMGASLERVPGIGKSSVRRMRQGADTKLVSFKTTQDQWLAFSRTADDEGWSTLQEVDAVVVISVDDRENPRFANVHLIDKADLLPRFDRAYAARRAAGHTIPVGRGVWISLYDDEKTSPVNLIGAGAGILFPPVAKVPLAEPQEDAKPADPAPADEGPLTIPEAKRRLAMTFGVDPSSIKISVEG